VNQIPSLRLRDLRWGYSVGLSIVGTSRGTRCLRIYDIALAIVASTQGRVEYAAVRDFIAGYQSVQPLKIAELMLLSTLLRAALLERATSPADASGARQTYAANAALVQGTDWRPLVSTAMLSNPVESILRSEFSGIYNAMELTSREPYWNAVEHLARLAEQRPESVAVAAVKLADQAQSKDDDSRRGHVGYYLDGAGRPELERVLQLELSRLELARRALQRHATECYLAVYLLLVSATVALAVGNPHAPSLDAAQWWLVIPLLVVALSQLVLYVVDSLLFNVLPARRLPRLDLSSGIPASARTLVAVPVMLMRPAQIRHLCALLEERYLGNRDPNLTFCLLTEFPDGPCREMPTDAALLETAREAIVALNQRHAPGSRSPFLLIHRNRTWNPHERIWMGWERKRGKLHMLNRLLIGFAPDALEFIVGDATDLAGVRYVLTMDDDTLLPPGNARELIGTALHPMNQPRFDVATGLVVEGFTIIQPAIQAPEEPDSEFSEVAYGAGAHLFYPHLFHRNLHQDAFGEASFHGKALYDVRAFERATEGAFPENRVLSHDVVEGSFARVGFTGDITLLEEHPSNYYAAAMRTHRWTRGDWQNLSWMMPRIPAVDSQGRTVKRRNPLSAISRWKIFNSLRQTLICVAQTLLLLTGWTVLDRPGYWTVLVLTTVVAPGLTGLLIPMLNVRREATVAQWAHRKYQKLQNTLHVSLSVSVVLPFQAYISADAIVRALWRTYVTRRRMLEWTPYSEVRSDNDLKTYLRLMRPMPVFVVLMTPLILLTNPDALLVAAPFLIVWFASPALAWHVSQRRKQ